MKIESFARIARSGLRATACIGGIALLSVALPAQSIVLADAAPATSPAQLFSVHPAEEGSTTLPGGHFSYALVPGQRVADGVVVDNLSSRRLTFQVYGADLITATGGGLAPAQPTATMRGVGAWITVATPTVTLSPHEHVTAGFTLAVPAFVAPGQHLGAIVVSADVGTTAQSNPIEARAALIAVVSIPGTAHPSAVLSPLKGSAAVAGQTGFGITISNNGNLLLTYAGSIDIVDGHGHPVAQLPLTPANAYVVPGGHAPLTAVWREAASLSGTYRAQATVTILVNGVAVETLRSQSLTVQVSSGLSLTLIAGVGIVALLGLMLVAYLVRWDIRRRRLAGRMPAAAVRERLA